MTLLTANVPALRVVEKTYPRLRSRSRTPRAIVWDLGYREQRLAGGTGGVKQKVWRISTLLVVYGKNPADAATLDSIILSVEALYRTKWNLDGLADLAGSKVLAFAEELDMDKPPPQMNRQFMVFQAVLTANCREITNS